VWIFDGVGFWFDVVVGLGEVMMVWCGVECEV